MSFSQPGFLMVNVLHNCKRQGELWHVWHVPLLQRYDTCLYFSWCAAPACYQYQWVVRDGDVFCQRSDGLRVDSKKYFYSFLWLEIILSISSIPKVYGSKKNGSEERGRSKIRGECILQCNNIVINVQTSPCPGNKVMYLHFFSKLYRISLLFLALLFGQW